MTMFSSRLALASAAVWLFAAPAWANPGAPVDPVRFVDQFEATFGKFAGYRRSGAKGICAAGEFVPTAQARALSRASVFSGAAVPVVARFSVGGANPMAADNTRSQRNMALQFELPGGERWLMGNINAPVFGASTPQQFLALVASRQPDPTTRQADPAKVKAFNDANPEVLLQGKHFASQPVPASYAGVNYWGVHAFGFENAAGQVQWGKWVFEPAAGQLGLTDDEAKAKGPHFLFDELRQRVAAAPVAFDFNLMLAEPGDKLDSATTPLPEGRKKVKLGTLSITSVAPDAQGKCLTINFDPGVMPRGVLPSADPMIAARAAPYAVSLGRRLSEGAKQQ